MQFDLKVLNLDTDYHAGFRKNNSIFTQNDRGFKRYYLQKKFIFWQLVVKIANFVDYRTNNSLFTKKKKQHILKLTVVRNQKFY